MSWARLDDQFPRHKKVRSLRRDTAAKWLHVTALCFCCEHLTDGLIEDIDLDQIIRDSEIPETAGRRCVPKLVEVGLWVEGPKAGSYVVTSFLEYNPTAAEVKEKRAQRAAAGARGGKRSGDTRRSKNEANGEANASANSEANGNPMPVPMPVPIKDALDLDLQASEVRKLVERSLGGAAS